MATEADRFRESHARFKARIDGLPALAEVALAQPIEAPPFDPLRVRRILVTGLGSSEAHARLLVHCLVAELGIEAHFVPTGALQGGPPTDASRDALIVFSQGLSPNARFALTAPERWGGFALVSAVGEQHPDAERQRIVSSVCSAGGWHVGFQPANEYGTLVRVAGPLTGCIVAIRMAEQLANAAGRPGEALRIDPGRVVNALRNAPAGAERALAGSTASLFDAPMGYLASGRYVGLLHNLRLKWLETLLLPMPPTWELLDFSHGPFQQSLKAPATWLAFTREDASRESDLLARLESLIEDAPHSLVSVHATLPGPWALVEHEALLNQLLLRALAHRPADLGSWPGKDSDGALYDLTPSEASCATQVARPPSARFDAARWPDLEQQIASGCSQILIPLGATEQHGAHLPLATDTWIADALAERLCARHPDLMRLPALALGCSDEHASFPGTLSLRSETLHDLLADLIRSLASHGFRRAFLFSAHGGNYATLARSLPSLRAAAQAMKVDAFTELGRLAALQHDVASLEGVSPGAAGHHAGEFETSILLGLAPGHVRRDALHEGLLHPNSDAQALFYPDLRAHAPTGVVGDPRGADGQRARRYLDAWVDLLDDAYRDSSGG